MAAFLEGPGITTLASHAAKALGPEGERYGNRNPPATPSESAWAPLVRFATEQTGDPLFCIHPLGGDVDCYFQLAQAMQDRPLVALRGRGGGGAVSATHVAGRDD